MIGRLHVLVAARIWEWLFVDRHLVAILRDCGVDCELCTHGSDTCIQYVVLVSLHVAVLAC